MSAANVIQHLQLGLSHHQAGRLGDAERIYRGVLRTAADHPDGLHLLGMLCFESGRAEEAERLVRRAIELTPSQAIFRLSLGNVLGALSRPSDAIESWQHAVRLAPDLVEAHANLAATLTASGDWPAAERSWREVLRLRASDPDAHFQLGQVLASQRRFAEAIEAMRVCVRLAPGNFVAHNALGVAYSETRQHERAAEAFATAAHLSPRSSAFQMNLGHALRALHRETDAEAAFRSAIELSRTVLGNSYHGLAASLHAQGMLDEAARTAAEAIRVHPELSQAYHSLGNIQYDAGLIDEAVSNYRRALELDPSQHETHSSLLLLRHYHHGDDAEVLREEHLAWARLHAEPLSQHVHAPGNGRDPARRLRVGYVSPDFRAHPVGFSIEPVLGAHDRDAVEVIAYYNRRQTDAWTQCIRGHCALWRDVFAMSDADLDQLIRDDRIDILVDLAGHTAGNRLLVFARRPAPIQMTYLGYPDTTGLSAMDYKLTDAWQDLPQNDASYTEKLIRLPGGAWCFHPREEMPEVGPLPADAGGRVTFISANKVAKVTDAMLAVWRQILRRVSGSRLLILTGGDKAGESRVRAAFDGIEGRVELVGRLPPEGYFELYRRSDIALDAFPYNGYMTTCDSLWMGVPVITLAGRTHVTRTGLSLLSKVGLDQFICTSPDDYIERAVMTAGDVDALRQLRAGMRQRLSDCGLVDGTRVARALEAGYREAWDIWCRTHG